MFKTPAILYLFLGCLIPSLSCAPAQAETRQDTPRQSTEPAAKQRPNREYAKRTKQIELLHKLIAQTQDREQTPKLLRRLVDLHLDQAEADSADGKLKAAEAHRKRAVDLLGKLQRSFQKHPMADEHLYLTAITLSDLNKPKEALKTFFALIKMHPQSRYLPDAYLALGEHYFNQAELSYAIKAFSRVIQFPDSPVRDYARYKLAWCWFNLADYEKATDMFARIAREAKPPLRTEALKDLVLAYAHTAQPAKAYSFFSKVAPGSELKLLERLAGVWLDQGRYAEAQQLHQVCLGEAEQANTQQARDHCKRISAMLSEMQP